VALAPTPTRAAKPLVPAAAPAVPPASAPSRATYLDLTYQGQPVRFAKSEIDRTRLYGLRKLIALDAEGHECQCALLTRDGRHLLPAGSTADLYVNDCGDAVAGNSTLWARRPCHGSPGFLEIWPAWFLPQTDRVSFAGLSPGCRVPRSDAPDFERAAAQFAERLNVYCPDGTFLMTT